MNIKVGKIKDIKYVNLLSLIKPLTIVALTVCVITANNLALEISALAANLIIANCNRPFDFYNISIVAIDQTYTSEGRSGGCPVCVSPIVCYKFKLGLHPNTVTICYACGTERTIIIGDDEDDIIYGITENSITKHGVCHAKSSEDII